ncbi:hypothetical protein MITS9504_02760 [Synechococcus sp. MIT S9504]|nr:hypothetical protein MITS9504_02760 [Synechococcus sp. MIT S9504]
MYRVEHIEWRLKVLWIDKYQIQSKTVLKNSYRQKIYTISNHSRRAINMRSTIIAGLYLVITLAKSKD